MVLRKGCELNPDKMLVHLDEMGPSRFGMPEFSLRLDKLPLMPNATVLKRELIDVVRRGYVALTPVRFRQAPTDNAPAPNVERSRAAAASET